jgi:sialidase-1
MLVGGFALHGLQVRVLAAAAFTQPVAQQADVFVAGQDHVNVYRIPAVIVSGKGTVLAFAEAREGGDQSPTDLVLKRSFDKGATWQSMQTVVGRRGAQAIMNPCPVVDQADGTIFLLCNLFPDAHCQYKPGAVRLMLLRSTDDGATWSTPHDITEQCSDTRTWASLCCGPGVGIQTISGRLVIPCWHHEGGGESDFIDAIVYSDDHGRTWARGGNVPGFGDEPQVVELVDGTLLLAIRSDREREALHHRHKIATSRDGGKTWSVRGRHDTLVTPSCQASILRYTTAATDLGGNRLLFSNPAHANKRVNMTVRVSHDEGATWPLSRTVYAGSSAYSCLTVLSDGTIGLLYEHGKKDPYERISFARFGLEWLCDGKDRLRPRSARVDALQARGRGILREGLRDGQEFVKVHAAEALIWNHEPEEVRAVFTHELEKRPVPKYRIGVWRVMARLADQNSADREVFLRKLRGALLDDGGLDRVHAGETLGKLGFAERDAGIVRLAESAGEPTALQVMARWILANSGRPEDERGLAALLDAKADPIRSDVAYAIRWLAHIQPETYLRLGKALADEPVGSGARVFLLTALCVHAPENRFGSVKSGLFRYLDNGTPDEKSEACAAFAIRGDVTDLGVLEGLMADVNLDTRCAAAHAVLQILARNTRSRSAAASSTRANATDGS